MERTTEGGTFDRLLPCAKIVVNGAAESAKMLSALRPGCSPDHFST